MSDSNFWAFIIGIVLGSVPTSVANWSADEPMGVDDDTSHKVH